MLLMTLNIVFTFHQYASQVILSPLSVPVSSFLQSFIIFLAYRCISHKFARISLHRYIYGKKTELNYVRFIHIV